MDAILRNEIYFGDTQKNIPCNYSKSEFSNKSTEGRGVESVTSAARRRAADWKYMKKNWHQNLLSGDKTGN